MEDEPGEMTRQEIIDEVAFTLGDEQSSSDRNRRHISDNSPRRRSSSV
jgi:hypothetical protein